MHRASWGMCPHNFRPSRGIAGKGNLCVQCICEKIDDLLESGADSASSQLVIPEIVYNVRLIKTSVESYDRTDGVLSESIIKRVIDTVAGLLKLSNDEIGLMTAQVVQKISSKISQELQEYIMTQIFNQIQDTPTLSLGVLEHLRVFLETEECLAIFQKQFGQDIMPKLFLTLRSTTNGAGATGGKRNSLLSSQSQSNSQLLSMDVLSSSQNSSQNFTFNECGGVKDAKYKMIVAVYSIIERTFEISTTVQESLNIDGKVTDRNLDLNTLKSGRGTVFSPYLTQIQDIITDSISQLRETQPVSVSSKILDLLVKMFRHEVALSVLLKSSNGLPLCSVLKRLLFSHTTITQKQSVAVIISMLLTHRMSESHDQSQRCVVDLPCIIQQVDLIHAICEALSTSDVELFRLILDLLSHLHAIPAFKGKLVPVVETGLRVVSVIINSKNIDIINGIHELFSAVLNDIESVPAAIQHQIVSLYDKLPKDWKPVQILPWAKLLLKCGDSNFLPIILNHHKSALSLLEKNPFSVTSLKLLLTLTQAVIQCRMGLESEKDECVGLDNLLLPLMEINCFPSLVALTRDGKATESSYIRTLLRLLLNYPESQLTPPKKYTESPNNFTNFIIENEAEFDDPAMSLVVEQNISLSVSGLMDQNGLWSSGAFIKILTWVRQNIELLKDKAIFDSWNDNVAKIVTHVFLNLDPSLRNAWTPFSLLQQTEEKVAWVSNVFQKLDLDMRVWEEVIGRPVIENSEVNIDLKLQQEAIMIFFYIYYLFNMEGNEGRLSSLFFANLAKKLAEVMNLKQIFPGFEWDAICFYFKTVLLIVSCRNPTSIESEKIEEAFETFICEQNEHCLSFDKVLTYCGKVFSTLIRWSLVPIQEVSRSLDVWSSMDMVEFQHFFKTSDLYTDTSEIGCAFRNHIVELTASGSKSASDFMIEVIKCRELQKSQHFEGQIVYSCLTKLKDQLLLESIDLPTQLRLSSNFSNLLELAVGENPMFCHEMKYIPVEFYDDIISVLMMHHKKEKIGTKSLKFLFRYLSFVSNGTVQRVCLHNYKFIQFLGNRLKLNKWNSSKLHLHSFEEGCLAFEIMSVVVNACDSAEDHLIFLNQDTRKVVWSITSLLPDMGNSLSSVSFLKFLIALMKKDLNPDIILVAESKADPQEVVKILLIVQFHAQSLLQKCLGDKCEVIIWSFLYEMLCFADRGNIGKLLVESQIHSDPWSLFVVQNCILNFVSAFDLSIECLQFVHKWAGALVNEQKRRKCVRQPEVQYQIFSYQAAFRQLSVYFTKGRENRRLDSGSTSRQNQEDGNSQQTEWEFNGYFTSEMQEFDCRKEKLIDDILLYCQKITDSNALDEVMSASSEDNDDDSCDLLQTQEGIPSSPQPHSSGSSTCSSSDFLFSPRV